MAAPVFDPNSGGRQSLDPGSAYEFHLNGLDQTGALGRPFTVSIEAISFGDGVDFQVESGSDTWRSLIGGPVKNTFCTHIVVPRFPYGSTYRFNVSPTAAGVVAEILSP